MPTFTVDNDANFTRPVRLAPEDERHLLKVLRARAGETIQLTDNRGRIATAEIVSVNPLVFAVTGVRDGPKPLPVTVCLPPLERERLAWAVEKLAELNAEALQLTLTERTQKTAWSEKQAGRLEKIAAAAQKQCGRAYPFAIRAPLKLGQVLAQPGAARYVALPPGETAANAAFSPPPQGSPCQVFIGPEGGFTAAETRLLLEAGCVPISLGATVLRAETAAMAAMAAVLMFSFKIDYK